MMSQAGAHESLGPQNKGEMSPKPSVLRFLKSDMLNAHSVIFHHGLELYRGRKNGLQPKKDRGRSKPFFGLCIPYEL